VCTICLGILISCYGEVRLHGLGLLIQSGALAFEAIRLIMTEKLLANQKIRFTPLLSLYYLSPICAGFCWAIALVTEHNALTGDHMREVNVWLLFSNGIVAFLLNIAAVFFISKSSSLSLALCGGPKGMMTIAASVWLWQDTVTPLQVGGFMLALLGLFFYNLIQTKKY
jgi:drug/metabolite transporter (DMT)-like permease